MRVFVSTLNVVTLFCFLMMGIPRRTARTKVLAPLIILIAFFVHRNVLRLLRQRSLTEAIVVPRRLFRMGAFAAFGHFTFDDGFLAYLFRDYVDDGIREPIVDFGSAEGKTVVNGVPQQDNIIKLDLDPRKGHE